MYVLSSSVLLPVQVRLILRPPLIDHLRFHCDPKSETVLG